MRSVMRPCPDCGAPRRGPTCRCGWRAKTTRPDLQRASSKRRSRDAVAAHVAAHGWVCPGWQRPPHTATDLTWDHTTAVHAGGHPDGPGTVLCRPCNSSKAAA